jgi:hypothetical protein
MSGWGGPTNGLRLFFSLDLFIPDYFYGAFGKPA